MLAMSTFELQTFMTNRKDKACLVGLSVEKTMNFNNYAFVTI